MKRLHIMTFLVAIVFLGVTGSASATLVTFDLTYSGASFGNSAVATGFITIDDVINPNSGWGDTIYFPSDYVTALSITVTGAILGNGTYDYENFQFMIWDTGGVTLDFTKELVGQATSGNPWGSRGGGDFNLFSSDGPFGYGPFILNTFGADNTFPGDNMLLTSMAPRSAPVPEPASMLLMGAGLMTWGVIHRRRRKAKS